MRIPEWARRPRYQLVQNWITVQVYPEPAKLIRGSKDKRIVQLRRTAPGTWRNERRL